MNSTEALLDLMINEFGSHVVRNTCYKGRRNSVSVLEVFYSDRWYILVKSIKTTNNNHGWEFIDKNDNTSEILNHVFNTALASASEPSNK